MPSRVLWERRRAENAAASARDDQGARECVRAAPAPAGMSETSRDAEARDCESVARVERDTRPFESHRPQPHYGELFDVALTVSSLPAVPPSPPTPPFGPVPVPPVPVPPVAGPVPVRAAPYSEPPLLAAPWRG